DKPRAPFAARFETELLLRIDQALGRISEPLPFISPPPVYCSRRHLVEPIATEAAVVAVAARLMRDLVPTLARDDVGARALRLSLYRVDSEVTTLDIGLVKPSRSAAHVARLIALKLDRVLENPDADFAYGFGFETVALAVTIAERIHERQLEMAA